MRVITDPPIDEHFFFVDHYRFMLHAILSPTGPNATQCYIPHFHVLAFPEPLSLGHGEHLFGITYRDKLWALEKQF